MPEPKSFTHAPPSFSAQSTPTLLLVEAGPRLTGGLDPVLGKRSVPLPDPAVRTQTRRGWMVF